MDGERKQLWDLDELRQVLANYHAEFNEQYKLLEDKLAKISTRLDSLQVFRPSGDIRDSSVRLKALQEYVQKLRLKNSIPD